MIEKASENLRVRKKLDACLYALENSDVNRRGEEIGPKDELNVLKVDTSSSVASIVDVSLIVVLVDIQQFTWTNRGEAGVKGGRSIEPTEV